MRPVFCSDKRVTKICSFSSLKFASCRMQCAVRSLGVFGVSKGNSRKARQIKAIKRKKKTHLGGAVIIFQGYSAYEGKYFFAYL